MFIDVRHNRRLLFRYDAARALVQIKSKDGDLVTVDLMACGGVMVDYQHLLKKYMDYIKDIEGYDFVTLHRRRSVVTFTPDEWAALECIARHDDTREETQDTPMT